MFDSKRTSNTSEFSDKIETIIGQDIQIKGSINAVGTIRVDGKVDGELSSKSSVVIGETGEIKAKIHARNALISGTVYSNVDVIDKLELTATAKLFGDIKTGTLIIDEGAVFKGACEMRRGNEPEPIFKEGKSSVPKS